MSLGIMAMALVMGLVIPWELARVVSRNFTGGSKVLVRLSTFVMILGLEIAGCGALFFHWLSTAPTHID
jgi:hypothetical protein